MRLIITLALLCGATPANGGKIEWQSVGIDAAVKDAKQAKKIVMAYFTADWCPYCKQQDEGAFSDDQVVNRSKSFIRVLINCTEAEAYEASRKKYAFKGIPAVIFIDGDGKALESVVGLTNAAGFIKRFDTYAPAAVPASAQEDPAKRILDRVQKELEDSQKRLREDIAKILKAELEKSGVAKTVTPKKSIEAQIDDLTAQMSDAALTGKLKKFLKTKEGLEFVKKTLEQGGLETVQQAVDQYFEKDAKGKLVLRAEFESQVESMLGEPPKDPPKDPPKVPAKKAYLGVSADDFSDDDRATLGLAAGAGLKVFEVKAGSPAEKAGIKTGDVIIQIGSTNVTEKGMSEIIAGYGAGDIAEFTVIRGKEKKTVKVTFSEKK